MNQARYIVSDTREKKARCNGKGEETPKGTEKEKNIGSKKQEREEGGMREIRKGYKEWEISDE